MASMENQYILQRVTHWMTVLNDYEYCPDPNFVHSIKGHLSKRKGKQSKAKQSKAKQSKAKSRVRKPTSIMRCVSPGAGGSQSGSSATQMTPTPMTPTPTPTTATPMTATPITTTPLTSTHMTSTTMTSTHMTSTLPGVTPGQLSAIIRKSCKANGMRYNCRFPPCLQSFSHRSSRSRHQRKFHFGEVPQFSA